MSQLFSHNAFNVLGLDSSASQKEIIKRSKEIVILLKNDERVEYDADLKTLNSVTRDEAAVKDAVQRLNSPIKRIQEYFFWFEIENNEDEKNLELLRDNQYDEALDNWQKRAGKSQTAKRNLAIASSILLNQTGYKKYLRLSIAAWDEIVNSDKFWSHFEKIYALNDEIGTSKSAIEEFHSKTLEYLSDFYTDVSRRKKDNNIYAAFGATFGTKGQKVQNEVLAPLFEQINGASEKLRKLNASQDNKLSSQESMAIKRLVTKIQDLFQEIKDLHLYDDSDSKVMRDKASEAINIVAVDLFNNLSEDNKAITLLKIAKQLSAGPAVMSQINKNIDYIQNVISQTEIITPINDLIEKDKYLDALEIIRSERNKNTNNRELQVYFRKRIQWCVVAAATDDLVEAKKLLDEKQYEAAESIFVRIYDFIYSYIADFDFDKNSIDTVLSSLRKKLVGLSAKSIDEVNNYRKQIIDNSDDDIKDENKFELPILTMLLDSLFLQKLAQISPELDKHKVKHTPPLFTLNGFGTKIYGDTLYLVLLFIPVLPLATYELTEKQDGMFQFHAKKSLSTGKKWWRAILLLVVVMALIASLTSGNSSTDFDTYAPSSGSNSSESSSSNTAWQICSDQYDSLKSQFEGVEATIERYEADDDVDSYNALVPRYNSLLEQVNSKATECNNLR